MPVLMWQRTTPGSAIDLPAGLGSAKGEGPGVAGIVEDVQGLAVADRPPGQLALVGAATESSRKAQVVAGEVFDHLSLPKTSSASEAAAEEAWSLAQRRLGRLVEIGECAGEQLEIA